MPGTNQPQAPTAHQRVPRRTFTLSAIALALGALMPTRTRANQPEPASSNSKRPATARIGHAHLHVRDLQRAIDFYTNTVGLTVTELVGNRFAFLSAGHHHHDLALQAIGSQAPDARPGTPGLYHVAFEAQTPQDFDELWTAVEAQGLQPASVNHGISWALYFDDPDGNGVEIYLDRRTQPGGTKLWNGQSAQLTRAHAQAALHHSVKQDTSTNR